MVKKEEIKESVKQCGIVMPISDIAGYSSGHWQEVLNILKEAINQTEFTPSLVSVEDPIGSIHARIVNNLHNNEIIICDVSGTNPNVMLELGLRLAFDKPTIIVKDELTSFSFDISGIEHIPYPSSLQYSEINRFKDELIKRIEATYQKSISDPNFSPFLKNYGSFVPVKVEQKEVPENEFILKQLSQITQEISIIRKSQPVDRANSTNLTNHVSYHKGLLKIKEAIEHVLHDVPIGNYDLVGDPKIREIEELVYEMFGDRVDQRDIYTTLHIISGNHFDRIKKVSKV